MCQIGKIAGFANCFIILKVVPFNSKQATAYELADILAGFPNLYADRSNWLRDTFIVLKNGFGLLLTREEQATIYDGFDAPKKVRFILH